jgi:penicillin amidase
VLSRRILRVLNSLLLIGFVLLAVGAWWFFWRPLPQTSGNLRAPVSARATVDWDGLGVPHIHAATQADAFLIQGYVTASERLWQMDTLRRAAAGDLCEIVGPQALELDEDSRRLRMRRIAESIYTELPSQDRADMTAYARGVNYFMETHHNRLPFEFAALGYDPKPWSVVDTILIGLYMFRDLTTSWPEHLEEADLLARGDPAKVALLFPSRAGLQRMGSFRRPHHARTSAAIERYASGLFRARDLVRDRARCAGIEGDGRLAAGRAGRHRRA